jgi:pimeloyl-ACP methyl ester carboxylesterase
VTTTTHRRWTRAAETRIAATTGLAVIGLGVVLAGCGGADPEASGPVAAPTTLEVDRPTAPIDDVFEVDGVGFHLHCTGEGAATVLLIAGWGAAGDDSWSAVHPALADEARVCTYDRPGTGTSDAPATDQTFETQAADLRALLDTAGEPGPYVVVGHSFGGAEAVTFTAEAPDEVTGLVLVDASPATWPSAVCAVPDDGTDAAASYGQLCSVFHDPSLDPERLDVIAAFEQVATIASLGDVPLSVITADRRTSPGLAAAALTGLDQVWDEGVATWAGLSPRSRVTTVADTGHDIQLEDPAVVLGEVRALLRP